MNTFCRQIFSLLLCLGIIFGGFPVYAEDTSFYEYVQAEESAENASIQVMVSMEDAEGKTEMIPPLSLVCPEGSTAYDVLELLRQYAYLSDFFFEDGELVRVEVLENDEIQYYGREGVWVLYRNGQEILAGESPVLQQGDQLKWVFETDSPTSKADVPNREQAVRLTGVWTEEYAKDLAAACSWLKLNLSTHFGLIGMGAAGVSADYRKILELKNAVMQGNSYANAQELAVDALAATFCGIPATNVAGHNLVEYLANYPDISRGGIGSSIFALLAVDSNEYEMPYNGINTRTTLRTVLLSSQNEDGGFGPAKGEASSPLLTAGALTALSAYTGDRQVQKAVEKGTAYLSQVQLPDGSFADSEGNGSAMATGAVVIALCALGMDIRDESFVKNQTLLEALLSFQVNSGGFAPEMGTAAEETATTMAILALTALKNGRNVLVLQTPLSQSLVSAASEVSAPSENSGGEDPDSDTFDVSDNVLAGGAGLAAGLLLGFLALAVVMVVFRKRK